MRRTLPLLLAVALSLAFAAPAASASLSERLVDDFADNGSLDACKYTEAELAQIADAIATALQRAWADRARHATAEAGWRASSTWAEFTDFVRFGR